MREAQILWGTLSNKVHRLTKKCSGNGDPDVDPLIPAQRVRVYKQCMDVKPSTGIDLAPGVYNFSELQNLQLVNPTFMAIYIPPGLEVNLFQGDRQGGERLTLGAGLNYCSEKESLRDRLAEWRDGVKIGCPWSW